MRVCEYQDEGSESQPRKVELAHAHTKNVTITMSILHIAMKPVLLLLILLLQVTYNQII